VSLADAVLFGRTFLNNITKFLMFQMPINLMLVILSLFYPIAFAVPAFVAVQILVINIVMDSLNSLSFGAEPAKLEYMKVPPQKKGASLFDGKTLTRIIAGCIEFGIVFALLFVPSVKEIFGDNPETNLTVRFALIMMMAAFNGFNVRVNDGRLLRNIGKNPMFLLIAFSIVIGTICIVQFGGSLFQVVPLSYEQWITVIILSFLVIPLDLIRKLFNR